MQGMKSSDSENVKFEMAKSLPSPERLPAAQGFGRRGFAQAGKCQTNVKFQI
jgi:hypothetical protein